MRCDETAVSVVIAASGSSERMGGGIKKEFLPLPGGKTVLAQAAEPFLSLRNLAFLVITLPQQNYDFFALEAEKALFTSAQIRCAVSKPHTFFIAFVPGGETRQESVRKALEFLAEQSVSGLVLVHDGARPFVSGKVIRAVIAAADKYGAAAPVIPSVDTLKQLGAGDDAGTMTAHFDRSSIRAVQTPQGFRFQPFYEAHRKAAADGKACTDDTEIWARSESPVAAVEGSIDNIKITYPKDLGVVPANQPETPGCQDFPQFRTGLGYDRHRLIMGRKLVLGGVELPFEKGEDGHSDGDVLFHAVSDALLGASGLGDIGSCFPPEDPQWKDADSADLLKRVWKDVRGAGWRLVNLDCVVLLEKPKMLPFRDKIRRSIAQTLETDPETVFVKAKTGEKTGEVGRGEIVEAWVVCLLEKKQGEVTV
ncbi:MAG: 2-C-methyl-D-erythritol 2,4-cyclodiphosphate synthase [Treponema sp.]|nr:2-C-methyl-D-erythritol 2,4-cyclodiphosphate synthase [Treponema sp.]